VGELAARGLPRIPLEDGRVDARALGREAITESELRSTSLERGFSSLSEVALVALEPDSHISVMGEEGAARWRDERGASNRNERRVSSRR
jgi:uncharacterized membrane protein YcaP (DUF421 family)